MYGIGFYWMVLRKFFFFLFLSENQGNHHRGTYLNMRVYDKMQKKNALFTNEK